MYICFNSLIQRRRYNYLNQICLCLPCVNLYSSAFKRNLYSSDSEIRYCTYQYIVWISFTHYFVTVRLRFRGSGFELGLVHLFFPILLHLVLWSFMRQPEECNRPNWFDGQHQRHVQQSECSQACARQISFYLQN